MSDSLTKVPPVEVDAAAVWTPCKHYRGCIGYCPWCIAELTARYGAPIKIRGE